MWWKRVGSADAVASAYGEAYADFAASGAYLEGSMTESFFRAVLSRVRRSGNRPLRLLDVGAGTGSLVAVACSMGFDADGIELNPRLVEAARARDLAVRCGRAEDIDLSEAYDVVTLMDLIEHVTDPLALLARVWTSLRPSGQIVVYTPNHAAAVVLAARALAGVGLDFAVREIFGRNHVAFFDVRTLRAALSRSGFGVRSMWRFPYDPRRPGQPMSRVQLAAVSGIEALGRPFGRVFRMVTFGWKRTA